MATQDVIGALQAKFPELGFEARPLVTYADGRASDQLWVRVPAERLLAVAKFLREIGRAHV